MDREERDIRLAVAGLHAGAGVLIWFAVASYTGHRPLSLGAAACLVGGAAVGLIVGGPLYRWFDRVTTERAARARAEFAASPEGRAYFERLGAVRALPLEEARRAAEARLQDAEPSTEPPPARVAALPCAAGEFFARYRFAQFGEWGASLESTAVAPLAVNGRSLVRIGWTEGYAIAVDTERGVVIDAVNEGRTPSIPEDAHEFPTVYHLIVFASPE